MSLNVAKNVKNEFVNKLKKFKVTVYNGKMSINNNIIKLK